MITDLQDYFTKGCGRCERFDTADCAALLWQEGLQALRTLCQNAGLEETLKWGHPCYRFAERNIAIIGAYRSGFRLSFFEAGLLQDAHGVLSKSGPNAPAPDIIHLQSATDVAQHQSAILDLLEQAKTHAQAGLRAPKAGQDLCYPEELDRVLSEDAELREAFARLTPGRQKSYILNLNSAQKSETRLRRLAKFRDKILAGKGALER